MSVYCSRSDVETRFGARNVAAWADLDNDRDAVAIDARITAAIAEASQRIDDYLRGSMYAVPFASTPDAIARIAAKLTGVLLYEARGVDDFDADSGAPGHKLRHAKRDAEDDLLSVRNGTLLLSVAPVAKPHPQAFGGHGEQHECNPWSPSR